MKIAYSFPFGLGSPGIGAAALSQIRALADRNCSVQVFCWSSPKPIPGVKLFQTQRLLPIPQRLMGRQRACGLHDFLTAALLKRWKESFDVVHTWPLAAEFTLRVARERGWLGVREAPNTHTGHAFDVVANEYQSLGIKQERRNSHTFDQMVLNREVREYDVADLILAPSELAIETFVRRGVPRSKLALKSYGFDPLHYTSHAGAHANKELTFSFVARCEPRKGLHLALEAWHRSGIADRSKFEITGRFIAGYRERLTQLLQHRNVKLNDFVADLRPVYQSADVLVLPSIEDGSALVTYEAQASGCALLVSDAAGARLTDGKEGFLHRPGDVETLARQMRTMADDPAMLLSMQKAAVVNAQQYTWQRATESLVNSYDAALSGTRA
ncbi:glycosyltransferase family 4 protein [Phenylobacterium sp.]|uniref:glycosyltransferase family 4 protein n=1 Tax=Phenylobacterium sp. TaxID=1871053 RepID=UPI002F407AD9